MKTATLFVVAATAALWLAGGTLAADRSDLEAAIQSWQDTFNAGDGRKAAETLYTPDARLLPPDSAMVEGTDAIAAFWQAVMDSPAHDLVLKLVDADIIDDNTAIETGTWTITVPKQEGGEMQIGGKTLVIWKRGEDGAWRMTQDMWNNGN